MELLTVYKTVIVGYGAIQQSLQLANILELITINVKVQTSKY